MEQIDIFQRQSIDSTPLLICLLVFSLVMPSQFTNETDHQALLAIKDPIPVDPFLFFRSWNESTHFCQWRGVTCSTRHHQRVTILSLSSLELVGSLSPQIGNLTFLRTIDLSNNSFHGGIPQEIGRLFRLQYLSLANNSFGRDFPTNLSRCSEVRVINVVNNNLEGKLPLELGSLSNLVNLNLAKNNFTASIPLAFGNLSSLLVLALAHNNLEGSIPYQLVQLPKLQFLPLGFNNLSGSFPPLSNISSITYFSVSGNQLHGVLPPDLGLKLPKLQDFHASGNRFDGHFPSSIVNASELVQIDISTNSFTGPFPLNFGNLHQLQFLNCHNNKLGQGDGEGNELMNLLTSLTNCSNLLWLDIASNRVRGMLPDSIANLSTRMTWFTLDSNYISGTIPSGIGNLVNLGTFFLSRNMLKGSIPDSIGKLSNLGKLLIDTNNITGEIPSSIGNLTRLGILSLSINMIAGSIPVSLGHCMYLQEIYLGANHLVGAIPQEIFGLSSLTILSLEQNYLTGQMPLQVGKLKNLGLLQVSENKLFGEIPSTLGGCQVIEFLYMQGNLFEGTIPAPFQQLKGLQVLDVSHNNLSGQIPSFLGELQFQYLNLSYNKFDGEVPNDGVFRNVSAFSVVGNNKLCGGIQELQLPACPKEVLNGQKRPFNLIVEIALVVSLSVVLSLVCLSATLYRIRSSKRQASSATMPLENQSQLSYKELLKATDGFSVANLIGQGGYGSVYKGILDSSDQIIAVKVLNLHERGANKSFVAECEVLRNIRHSNIVKVITSCSSVDFKGNDFKALVFEFMGNGSLESWLHPTFSDQQDAKNLNFVQRLDIAIDLASALDYLHHHCEMAFVHCDLKPSNILLDDDLCAHVGDFGMAMILSATTAISRHQQSSSIGIRGTIGYVAPEYGMGEAVSTQGDMYSYGVLLLEMFTGKRPTDNIFTNNISLHNYVKTYLPYQIMEIVDSRIILEEELPSKSMQGIAAKISKLEVCLASVLQIGVSCSSELPKERMNAGDVLTELYKIRNVCLGIKAKGHQDESKNDS